MKKKEKKEKKEIVCFPAFRPLSQKESKRIREKMEQIFAEQEEKERKR